MRCVEGLRRKLFVVAILAIGCAALTGCKTVSGGPDRLYSVDTEVARARLALDGSEDVAGLVSKYYSVDPTLIDAEDRRKYFRNEIIALRMYVIDVEYSEYEASLTNERQKFGFLTTAAATSLGIASTLTTPVRSAQLLSGIGAAVLSSRGAYDTEVVIAKTIQIVQGHMRAQRDNVATTQILPRKLEATLTYPLSAALHDLEDYYNAGTFTSGLIPALRESGEAARVAADGKTFLVQGAFNPNEDTSRMLRAYIMPGGIVDPARRVKFNSYLQAMGYKFDVGVVLTNSRYAGIRLLLIQWARNKGEKI